MDTVTGSISIADFLFRYQSALTVVAATVATQGLKTIMGAASDHPWAQRLLLPLSPAIFGLLVGLAPGWLPGALGERFVGGALLGMCAPALFSIVKRRIDPAADASPPPAGAAP
jgi:hypothetical protein